MVTSEQKEKNFLIQKPRHTISRWLFCKKTKLAVNVQIQQVTHMPRINYILDAATDCFCLYCIMTGMVYLNNKNKY